MPSPSKCPKNILKYFQIEFPGVSGDTFTALQEYLYTGNCTRLEEVYSIELIELANRLCLPRLLAITEEYIIRELMELELAGQDIYEDTLRLIEPAQVVLVYRYIFTLFCYIHHAFMKMPI